MRRTRIAGGGEDAGGDTMCSSAKARPSRGTDNADRIAPDNATGANRRLARLASMVNAERLCDEQSCGSASAGPLAFAAWHEAIRASGGAHNGSHQTLPPATAVITAAQISAMTECRRERLIGFHGNKLTPEAFTPGRFARIRS